ncbi:hexose carrier protein, partial [Penicillium cosmopolitanum]
MCSIVQSATGGYDGSMLNGLNILPLYTDYFELNNVTKGLNTASVSIGGFIGPLVSGIAADRLGRRPAIFWGSCLTILGIIVQTAAQNIAMEDHNRAWKCYNRGFRRGIFDRGVSYEYSEYEEPEPRFNLGYSIGALIAAGVTLGTGQWLSTWAWRAPSLFQAIFSLLCILTLPFIPESPRWLVQQGHYEEARLSVAQTNSHSEISDPVVVAIFKEIVDTLKWEREEGHGISPIEILKRPVIRKRLLVGISAGPFSCIAGNVIASYYLGSELDTAGITDTKDQLKA